MVALNAGEKAAMLAFLKSRRGDKELKSDDIVSKLLDRYKAGKEIKELMPVKGAIRVIFQVYSKKMDELKQQRSLSPEVA